VAHRLLGYDKKMKSTDPSMLFVILSNMPVKYTLYFYKILVFLYRHTYTFIHLFIYFYLMILTLS